MAEFLRPDGPQLRCSVCDATDFKVQRSNVPVGLDGGPEVRLPGKLVTCNSCRHVHWFMD